MRIAIVTISDSIPNFGNKLQNYAVQEMLKEYSNDVKTIVYDTGSQSQKLIHSVKYYVHRITGYRLSTDSFNWKYKEEQKRQFQKFSNRYISELKVTGLEDLSEKADFFILGSDQVWNPSWYCLLYTSDAADEL